MSKDTSQLPELPAGTLGGDELVEVIDPRDGRYQLPIHRFGLGGTAQQKADFRAGIGFDGTVDDPIQINRSKLSKVGRYAISSQSYNSLDHEITTRASITGGEWSTDHANSFLLSNNRDKFIQEGGVYVSNGNPNDFPMKSSTVAVGNNGVENSLSVFNSIEFNTTAAQVRLKFYVGGGNTQHAAFRIAIDGKYQQRNDQKILTFTGQPAGSTVFINIDFTSFGGGGIKRNIRFEWDNGVNLGNLSYDSGVVWAPYDNQPSVCFFGDSWFAFGSGVSGLKPAFPLSNVAVRAGRKLGWRVTCSAVGGTGFVNNGGVNYTFNSPQRLSDLSLRPFDAFVIAGGTNDYAGTQSNITASALQVLQECRNLNQDAPIFVVGCWHGEHVTSPLSQSEIEQAIYDAYLQFNDTNCYFIPVTNDPSGAWVTASNKSIYIDTDNTHAKPVVGEEYFADRLCQKIREIFYNQ